TFIPDIQGSIIGTLDAGTGTLSKRGYLPYGASASATGSFAYTGQRIDPETSGLYYYRARMYMPVWGRFLQPDPAGYAAGSNLYGYVGNDPLNNTDPTGLLTLQLGIAGGGTIFGFAVPQGGFGIVVDTRGNIGTYAYVGLGVGLPRSLLKMAKRSLPLDDYAAFVC
ncbi:MAG TPA: RHS repeat-associated core domain-containing protein, partial [Burkholderiales bacterium]